jgi:hypothetical protein
MQARFGRKLGLVLIIAACGMWAAISVVAFLPLVDGKTSAIAQKAVLTTTLVVSLTSN